MQKSNPFSASPVFGQVQKFFLENLSLARFICWRDISRDLVFSEDFELFFIIGVKKMINQVINEIFRQMTITLTLPLDVPVRPMDAKGLNKTKYNRASKRPARARTNILDRRAANKPPQYEDSWLENWQQDTLT